MYTLLWAWLRVQGYYMWKVLYLTSCRNLCMQVSICSIFSGNGDVASCISYAADSIGIEMPTFELLKYDPYDWIKRTQVKSPLLCYFISLRILHFHFCNPISFLFHVVSNHWCCSMPSLNYHVFLVPDVLHHFLQESFDPVEVTKGLWIVPEWKTVPVWVFLSLFSYLLSKNTMLIFF